VSFRENASKPPRKLAVSAGCFLRVVGTASLGKMDHRTSKQVGDRDHLKVFANADAAETWFAENDPEGVAFEYEVLE